MPHAPIFAAFSRSVVSFFENIDMKIIVKFTLPILLACVLIASAGISNAQEAAGGVAAPLTLAEALKITYSSNPSILAARSEYKAVQERLPQALSGWRPTVLAGASVVSVDMDSDPASAYDGTTSRDYELTFTQPLYRGGKTVAETDAAWYLINAQGAVLQGAEQNVLLQAASAYMGVVRARAILDLQRGNQELIARQLEATRARFQVGELTRTDVSQAEARLANAQSAVISATGALKSAQASFEQVTGLPPEGLAHPKLELYLPDNLEEAITIAEKNSPEVVASEYAYEASRKGVRSLYGDLLPQIGLSGSWNKTSDPSPGMLDETTTRIIGVSATIPLYQAGAASSRIREAKHLANRRLMDISTVRRTARENAIGNWEELMAARAGINSRKAQVEAAAIAREGVREEAEVGARTILDVLDADQEYLDSEVALVTAKTNEILAAFALARSLGLLTPENLGFPEVIIDYSQDLEQLKWKLFGTDVENPGQK